MNTEPQTSTEPATPSATNNVGPSDAELVRDMAEARSRQALHQFYGRHAGRVFAVLLRILNSRADAEELLQEVFVEVWQRCDRYDPNRASARAWLYTVARSRALDAVRARRSRGGGKDTPDSASDLQAPEATRPDAQAARTERRHELSQALSDLSHLQREALELSYFAGLSHTEIAAHL